jgi:hypothetical protein
MLTRMVPTAATQNFDMAASNRPVDCKSKVRQPNLKTISFNLGLGFGEK